ncbi:MAG: hypothetical protein QNK11_07495 [Legionella sp.]|nr:hypothetical protein [Legionella sp.]
MLAEEKKATERDAINGAFYYQLSDYFIEKLGGNNSKNFKLTHRETGEKIVLKVENRLGLTNHAASQLRKHGLSDVLTPILAENRVTIDLPADKNGKVEKATRNVQFTTFCLGSDLEKAAKKHKKNDTARICDALDIYTQMVDILGVIEANGCVFSDMKNSNWLLDAKGNLRIADTKGFFFADKYGLIDAQDTDGINGVCGINFPCTPTMTPIKNFWTKKPTPEQAHVYMLGKNLYQYLTDCSMLEFASNPENTNPNLVKVKKVDELNFSAPIFQTEEGMKLEATIKKLMVTKLSERPSLDDAKEMFEEVREILKQMDDPPEQIKNPPVRETSAVCKHVKACTALMNPLKASEKMDALIEIAGLKMGEVKTPEGRESLQNILKNLDASSSDESIEEAKQNIEKIEPEFKACRDLLIEIATHRITTGKLTDTKMDVFLKTNGAAINDAKTQGDITALQTKLERTLEGLKSSKPYINEIEKLITKPQKNIFGLETKKEKKGMPEKREEVRAAILNVDLEKRADIANNLTVLKALGSQRKTYIKAKKKSSAPKKHRSYLKPRQHRPFRKYTKKAAKAKKEKKAKMLGKFEKFKVTHQKNRSKMVEQKSQQDQKKSSNHIETDPTFKL